MCSLAQIRIILLITIYEPILVRTVGRAMELALYLFVGKTVLIAAEKVGFLGELCTLKVAVVRKPSPVICSHSWEVLFSVFIPSQEAFSFSLVQ